MKILIKYTSQIAMAAKIEEETFDTNLSTMLEVIKEVSKNKTIDFQNLLWGDSQKLNPSILVIVNGNQIQDLSALVLKDGDEIILFSPMAGG